MKNVIFAILIALSSAIVYACELNTEIIKIPQINAETEEIYMVKFYGFLGQTIDIEVKDFIARLRSDQEVEPRIEYSENSYSWLIMAKNKDEDVPSFAGVMQAELSNDDRSPGYLFKDYAALSFFIHPDYRGKNLAYRASSILIDHMLQDSFERKIYGFVFDVADKNEAAQHIMQKFLTNFGFTKSCLERTVYLLGNLKQERIMGYRWFKYYRNSDGSLKK